MDYLSLMDQYREEMISALQEMIQIKSVVEPAESHPSLGYLPFGPGVHRCFQELLDRGIRDGFTVKNVDNYGGHIEWPGNGPKNSEDRDISHEIVGILGHLDVVPEGSHWEKEPYGGVLEDGRIYGRGASDDKGPVMACYFAMKALKDAGVKPSRKIRLILGLDEETNWEGIQYYLAREKAPDRGFTPDADFPVIHGEKGILIFEVAKKFNKTLQKGLELRSLTGGNAPNMVPDSARAVLRGAEYGLVREVIRKYKEETGHRIQVKGIGKNLEIVAQGVSAHGARPEQGMNAISMMMELLAKLPLVHEDLQEFIEFYNKHIGFELDGQSLGCGLSDEASGKLILNVGTLRVDQEAARLIINVRYPVTFTEEQVYQSIMPLLNQHHYGLIRLKHQPPIFFPKDHPMVTALMEVYRKHTGDFSAEPLVIGGGTYARATENILAFGMTFPGEEEVAHQKNEYVAVDSLIRASAIYAEAIQLLAE